jgi:hypothetical protein
MRPLRFHLQVFADSVQKMEQFSIRLRHFCPHPPVPPPDWTSLWLKGVCPSLGLTSTASKGPPIPSIVRISMDFFKVRS